MRRKTKTKTKTCFGSNLGKGRRLPIPNIPGDEWENQSTQGKTPINLDEGFTAIKAQENNERERDAHIRSHTIAHTY